MFIAKSDVFFCLVCGQIDLLGSIRMEHILYDGNGCYLSTTYYPDVILAQVSSLKTSHTLVANDPKQ